MVPQFGFTYLAQGVIDQSTLPLPSFTTPWYYLDCFRLVLQVIDQTGEIAYWFYVVARQIEKAEAGGRYC
jgi:hypothetical protein